MLAEARVAVRWRYAPPYDFYNADPDHAELDAVKMARDGYFAAREAGGDLVGIRCFGPEGRVPGFAYDDRAIDTGGALRPDLTGRGMGSRWIAAGLAFGTTLFGAQAFRVTVAAFNMRAQRALAHAGFRLVADFRGPAEITFMVMLRDAAPLLPSAR